MARHYPPSQQTENELPPQQTFVTASASLPEKAAAFLPWPLNLRTSCMHQAEATDVTSLGESCLRNQVLHLQYQQL